MGLATAELLVGHGVQVIGCARNIKTLQDLAAKVGNDKIHAITCDLSKENEVLTMFKEIREKFGKLDVVINNAGMAKTDSLLDGNYQGWKDMLDLNILAVTLCTREAVKIMEDNKPVTGHVVNINSYIGHHMVLDPASQFYSATKFMITALTNALRKDCQPKNIRVTSLSPGLTETEFATRSRGESGAAAYQSFKCLEAKDVAEAVVYILSSPPHVNVDELTMTAFNQKLF